MDEDKMSKYQFFRVTDSTGTLKTEEIKDRPLTRKMLKDSESYILGMHDLIYVWQGQKASTLEKRSAMQIADAHKKQAEVCGKAHIIRLPEGAEDAHFMSFFDGFADGPKMDFGMDKGMDTSTTANQDISKVAN